MGASKSRNASSNLTSTAISAEFARPLCGHVGHARMLQFSPISQRHAGLKIDTRRWSNAEGQAASLEQMDWWHFRLGSLFRLKEGPKPKTSPIHVLDRCCLTSRPTPVLCVLLCQHEIISFEDVPHAFTISSPDDGSYYHAASFSL